MSVSESTTLPLALTSLASKQRESSRARPPPHRACHIGETHKQPLRGFSALISTFTLALALTKVSSFEALVLNAFHDLHASMVTPELEEPVDACGKGTGKVCLRQQ